MPRIELSRKGQRFIEGLPPKHRRRIIGKIRELAANPFPPNARKLMGDEWFRVRVVEYRIIYRVVGDILRIALVGKRGDDKVYRQLRRLREF
jgi:mRNA interferase RelE/StbE